MIAVPAAPDSLTQLSWEADEYVLGRIDSSRLPMIAAQALARGTDSPALRELAGLGRAEVREARDLFVIAMAELGQPLREPEVVLWHRASQAAQGLLDGIRDAGDAIGEIAWLLCNADGQHGELATDFEMLLIDWDESPAGRAGIAKDSEQACRRLLDVAKTIGTQPV
ncbi:hypothetical protein [Rhizocola hellebori]|uniref:hypothetical protein n=1 Tax=Rhizocola hellebori TaxID=1392758 RepID=UPI001945094D|nr:hypothetical protein [Rhizocola hellebori]